MPRKPRTKAPEPPITFWELAPPVNFTTPGLVVLPTCMTPVPLGLMLEAVVGRTDPVLEERAEVMLSWRIEPEPVDWIDEAAAPAMIQREALALRVAMEALVEDGAVDVSSTRT